MYEKILVPTDGSEATDVAARHAVDIASRYGGTLHALYVVDVRMSPISTEMDRDDVVQLFEEADEKPTTPVLERAKGMNVPTTEAVRIGVPHESIREYIAENDIDLVVMGTHGRRGLDRYLLGSVTEKVVRVSDAPVLTVRMPDESADESS